MQKDTRELMNIGIAVFGVCSERRIMPYHLHVITQFGYANFAL
jgi:hypothetical protein